LTAKPGNGPPIHEDIPDSFLRAWNRLSLDRRLAITRAINARVDAGEKVIDAFRAELGGMWAAVEGWTIH
jgi:hypothetical protein